MKLTMDFSVLMSVYYKEKPEYLRACLESVLAQTKMPAQILLVKDGTLTPELDAVIDEYNARCPIFKILPLEKNVGLGTALAIGVEAAETPLIARMDTDDIAKPERFAEQCKLFDANPALEICGAQIEEFEGEPSNILSRRHVPTSHEEIMNYARRRNPFNHMTVMYKKAAVLKAGNYKPCPDFEDYYLWCRMLAGGAVAANHPDYLLYARTGAAMFQRRGGMRYCRNALTFRKLQRQTGLTSPFDRAYAGCAHIVFSLMPGALRGKLYKKILRK